MNGLAQLGVNLYRLIFVNVCTSSLFCSLENVKDYGITTFEIHKQIALNFLLQFSFIHGKCSLHFCLVPNGLRYLDLSRNSFDGISIPGLHRRVTKNRHTLTCLKLDSLGAFLMSSAISLVFPILISNLILLVMHYV